MRARIIIIRVLKFSLFFAICTLLFIISYHKSFSQGGQPAWQGTSEMPAYFLTEVAKGNVPGHSVIHKFGHANVGTTLVPISPAKEYKTPTVATALEFVSGSANDTAAGSGAREITITGIDANYDEITQVIATNGLTAVPIPTSLLRIYEWSVSKSGTYATSSAGSHVGILTIRVASAGAIWSQIEISPFPAGRSEIGAYTVPDGYRAFIHSVHVQADSTKSIDLLMFKREGIDTVVAPFTVMKSLVHFIGISPDMIHKTYSPIDSLPARTDIGFMAKVGAGTADVSVQFEILLIKTGY